MTTMRRLVRMLALTLLLAGAAGCQTTRVGGPGSEPSAMPAVGCTVAMPADWKARLQAGSPHFPSDERVVPLATGLDPTSFFAELYSPSWSGVVSVDVASGHTSRISPFSDPANDQAVGAGFDGRWLVWGELFSLEDSNDWQIKAWDSSTQQSFVVATAPLVNGTPVSGPILQPLVSGGRAAWVQANQSGIGEVHLYTLATRQDQVLDAGSTPPIRFWGANLIWQHLDVPGRLGHLMMVNVSTLRQVQIPEPLASVHQLSSLAVSSQLVAWTDSRSVRVFRVGQTVASIIFPTPVDHADFLSIAANLVTWDGPLGPSALDVRSNSATRLTPQYGGRLADGNSLLVYWPLSQTKGLAPLAITDVDASKLSPLAPCVG